MRKRILYIFLPLLLVMSVVTDSCKKESQTSLVESLLTRNKWQLASVMVLSYIGSNSLATDTLNTQCSRSQVFTFNANGTCTYTNFSCIAQTTQGEWSLTTDDLFLNSTMACTDTVPGSKGLKTITDKPFTSAKIVNLGQYSLVLETGDIATYYTANTKRVIVEYGFVHPSSQ